MSGIRHHGPPPFPVGAATERMGVLPAMPCAGERRRGFARLERGPESRPHCLPALPLTGGPSHQPRPVLVQSPFFNHLAREPKA